jgi:transposase
VRFSRHVGVGSIASISAYPHDVRFTPDSDRRTGNLVERFFNKIEQCRRVATRHDKLAANYLAFVQLASIRLWLRVNESTPWR